MTESQISFVDEITNWKTTSLESFLVYNTPSNWNDFFKIDEVKRELSKISIYLEQFTDQIIYPEIVNIFRSLYLSDPSSIKAIILGQDPYHNGSAIGLAFSVKRGNHVNPSLLNIYRELKRDGIIPLSEDGDLHHWASQGILLLNTSLTVTKGNPCIHIKIWNRFTELLLTYINNLHVSPNLVWMLFGNNAYQAISSIDIKGKVVRTSHPSPFSANSKTSRVPAFIGSGVFSNLKHIIW
jgi:uracil-DNA glycosylase